MEADLAELATRISGGTPLTWLKPIARATSAPYAQPASRVRMKRSAEDLDVRQAGGVVDADVHVLPADLRSR